MMKKILIASMAIVVSLASCGNSTSVPKPKNGVDSLSVAFGAAFGSQLKSMQITSDEYNVDQLVAALKASAAGEEVMTAEQINEVIGHYFQVVRPAKALKEAADFMAQASKNGGLTTESGLIYKILEAGDNSNMPKENDTVTVHYVGTLPNGEVFESSRERNQPATFPLTKGGLIPGWIEGLQYIGKGGKIELYIPSDLAYGPQGRGSIGPNQALKFEIEILEVVPKVETPEAPEK